MKRNVLIITSSCGGGLLSAAIAKEQEERAKHPSVVIVKRNIMADWYPKSVFRFGIRTWNGAQRRGDNASLNRLIKLQKYADMLFWLHVFYSALTTLFQEDIDHIVDTQPLGTSAILSALRIFNRRSKKQVVLDKVVVDLPTDCNTHFLQPVKRLSSRNRRLLRLITLPPLLKSKETAEEFWNTHCNLSEHEVRYEYFPIRQDFLAYQGTLQHPISSIVVRISNAEERELIARSIARGPLLAHLAEERARFFFAPQDRIFTLLLGSQPAFHATLGYVRAFIRLEQEKTSKSPLHLFVLCAEHGIGEDSLLRQVSDLVCQLGDQIPSHLTIIPLSFQKAEVIAPLFARSNLTCTRSGGQTAMELMCVVRGEIWIHSETKKKTIDESLSLHELLQGIPGWEAGNALYLHQLYQAKIVTPDSIHDQKEH